MVVIEANVNKEVIKLVVSVCAVKLLTIKEKPQSSELNQIIGMMDSSVASTSSVTTPINDASVPVPNNSQEVNVVF